MPGPYFGSNVFSADASAAGSNWTAEMASEVAMAARVARPWRQDRAPAYTNVAIAKAPKLAGYPARKQSAEAATTFHIGRQDEVQKASSIPSQASGVQQYPVTTPTWLFWETIYPPKANTMAPRTLAKHERCRPRSQT